MGLAVGLEVAKHRLLEILPVGVLRPDVIRLVFGFVDRDRAAGLQHAADFPEDRLDPLDVLHKPHQVGMVKMPVGPREPMGIADAEIG